MSLIRRALICVLVAAFAWSTALSNDASAAAVELTTNGDFETGDLSGWTLFPNGGTVSTTADSFGGSFAGLLETNGGPQSVIAKQANIGVGVVVPGDLVTISFLAKASSSAGGVEFAELFSEISGGGVSAAQILSGGPLFPGAGWTPYSFTATAGPDVSGGITLQLVAASGADIGSTSTLFVDNVSVSVERAAVPEPGSLAVLAFAGTALAARRRRRRRRRR